jgi:hypothetical protein
MVSESSSQSHAPVSGPIAVPYTFSVAPASREAWSSVIVDYTLPYSVSVPAPAVDGKPATQPDSATTPYTASQAVPYSHDPKRTTYEAQQGLADAHAENEVALSTGNELVVTGTCECGYYASNRNSCCSLTDGSGEGTGHFCGNHFDENWCNNSFPVCCSSRSSGAQCCAQGSDCSAGCKNGGVSGSYLGRCQCVEREGLGGIPSANLADWATSAAPAFLTTALVGIAVVFHDR